MAGFQRVVVLVVVVLFTGQLDAQLTREDVLDVLPPNLTFDAATSLTVRSRAEVLSTRREITQHLWQADTLPFDQLPSVTAMYGPAQPWPEDLVGISTRNVAFVEHLMHDVGYGLGVESYLIHPIVDPVDGPLAIVHQGHSSFANRWEGGLDATTERLLAEGFTVMAMQMPQKGWNQAGGSVLIAGEQQPIDASHDTLFELLGEREALRMFIEPVISSINFYQQQHPGSVDIAMVGLSGGGWTTHVAAAVDPRISLSVPVAGIVPLDLNRAYPYSLGDGEQVAPGLTEHIAGYLDLFVLAAEGDGRRQIQILNQFDTCCFYGIGHETYVGEMAEGMGDMESGEWDFVLDSTHVGHQVSPFALEQIVAATTELKQLSLGDCNHDRQLSALDLSCVDTFASRDIVISAIGSLLGDLDGGGTVGISDFLTLSSNYGRTGTVYDDGDIDLSGDVGFNDFLSLSGRFGAQFEAYSHSVPEPNFMGWCWLALLPFRQRRSFCGSCR